MLSELQQYLRAAASAGRETEQVGPFLATCSTTRSLRFFSYAIPQDGAEPTPHDVDALVAWFTARDRIPRLEFFTALAPAVEPALTRAGFAVEDRLAAMFCGRAADVPVPEGVELAAPRSLTDLAAMLGVQHVAFGDLEEPGEDDVNRAQASAADGTLQLLARDSASGEVVGGGVASAPDGSGFTEVAGIAVAASHRRRGIAAALTAELTRRAVAAGVTTAFLTPADDGAAEAYVRAGYAKDGLMLHISRE